MADTDNTAADTPNDTATSTTETTSHKGDVDNKTDDDTKAQDILTALGLNTIYVYISSVSLDTELKVRQRRVIDALASKQVPYEVVDIAHDRMAKRRMRHMSMDENAVPPRIFRGEIYLGDYFEFQEALDQKRLDEFLTKLSH